tara:strand:- start:85 stop:825 length:741 start_codon:yes stop_codon:yes gene_type:complete
MPYNFTPLEYNPFQVTNPLQPPNAHDYLDNHGGPGGWGYAEAQRNYPYELADQRSSQFQDYGQNQFQSLFDAVNSIGASPFTSGDAFYNTPQYEAVSRDPYTTQTPATRVAIPYSGRNTGYGTEYRWEPGSTTFDQQGYDAARMDNMMNYLTDLGGFFQSMGSTPSQQAQQQIVQQGQIARDLYQAGLPQIQSVQPAQPLAYTGGGWGQQQATPQATPMTYRGQSPSGMLGTTNRGTHGGILGGNE